MATVTAFEAKTRFGELLERVSKGEEVVITRHDKPVARLIPEGAQRLDEVRRSVEGLRDLQQRIDGDRRPSSRIERCARLSTTGVHDTGIVADASVAIGWVHPAQATRQTAAMLDAIADGATLEVPALWSLEVATPSSSWFVDESSPRTNGRRVSDGFEDFVCESITRCRRSRFRGCPNWPPRTSCRSTTPRIWSWRSAGGSCWAARTARCDQQPSRLASPSGPERNREDASGLARSANTLRMKRLSPEVTRHHQLRKTR